MKREVGLSLFPFQPTLGDAGAIELAAKLGVDAVDLGTCNAKFWDYRLPDSVYSRSDEEIIEHFTALRERAEALGIRVAQTHGRISGFINVKEEDEAFIENARLDCLAASVLGVDACVIHSVSTHYIGPDAPRELMHKLNFEMFSRILEHAKRYGVKIASETFGNVSKYKVCDFFGQIDEFVESYERICAVGDNAKYMSICLDTGHCNTATPYGEPPVEEIVRRLGSRISVLHLHDNNANKDQHKIPMTGEINWTAVFDALDEIDYDGVYNLELSPMHFGKNFQVEEAEFGVKVMRNIIRNRYGE